MEYLNWIAAHPILSVIFAYLIAWAVGNIRLISIKEEKDDQT